MNGRGFHSRWHDPRWWIASVALVGTILSGCLDTRKEPASPAELVPAAAKGALQFADITRESGVTFRHDRASSGRKYFVETMGAGVAMIDYDGDGLLDLFFPNGAPLPGYQPKAPMRPALYRNLGAGWNGPRFQDVTEGSGLEAAMYGMGCAVGDFDRDGRDDLYVTAVLGPSRLFRNLGATDAKPRFQDVTQTAGVANQGRFGTSAAWLDYDLDGDLDLYVCNYVRYRTVADDLPCYFKDGVRSYCIPFAYEAEPNRLYRNEGGGKFTDVSKQAGVDRPAGKSLGVSVADFDRDGWPDLFIANDTTPTQLFRNNKDGTFSEIAAAQGIAYGMAGAAKAGMGIDVADDANNGRLSVVMGNFSAEMVGYYQIDEAGFFTERSVEVGLGEPSRSFLTFGTLFLDADNDGWKDLLLANGHVQDNVADSYTGVTYQQRPLLYRNRGVSSRGIQYEEIGTRAGDGMKIEIVARSAARGDLDNDGRIDLVLTENNGPARILRNTGEGLGNWLRVRLRGTKSNPNGYGSKLILTIGAVRQTVEQSSGGSYLSQNDQRVHFGLGAARKADRLEIRWPSGIVDQLAEVDGNREITVTEGKGANP